MKEDLIHFLQSVKSGDTLEDRSRRAKRAALGAELGSAATPERCLPRGASKVSYTFRHSHGLLPRTLTGHLTRLHVMGRLVWVTPVHGGVTSEREARTPEC